MRFFETQRILRSRGRRREAYMSSTLFFLCVFPLLLRALCVSKNSTESFFCADQVLPPGFADKPGSVSQLALRDGHLSRTAIARGLQRSTRVSIASRMSSRAAVANSACSLFDLASSGVYPADRVTSTAGELLPHLCTLATHRREVDRSAVKSLWHCP